MVALVKGGISYERGTPVGCGMWLSVRGFFMDNLLARMLVASQHLGRGLGVRACDLVFMG